MTFLAWVIIAAVALVVVAAAGFSLETGRDTRPFYQVLAEGLMAIMFVVVCLVVFVAVLLGITWAFTTVIAQVGA